jgi:hypothetical protein
MQRRFLYGSLVCLSSDRFADSFIFGTVVDRDGIGGGGRAKLQKQQQSQFSTIEKSIGTIGILLQSAATAQLHEGTDYWLVESPAFYECYSHVLRALQVPFHHFYLPIRVPIFCLQYGAINGREPGYLSTGPVKGKRSTGPVVNWSGGLEVV